MGRKTKAGIVISFLLIAFYCLGYQWNEWFSETMVRHQIYQLPLAVLIGIVVGIIYHDRQLNKVYWNVSALIFSLFSFSFWMLPHSIDLTIFYPSFNRLMIINMIIIGFLMILALRNTFLELQMFFLGMVTAMLFAVGITLTSLQELLCSSFDITQQHQTGQYLLYLAAILFVLTVVVFGYGINHAKEKYSQTHSIGG